MTLLSGKIDNILFFYCVGDMGPGVSRPEA